VKFLPAELFWFLRTRASQRNLGALARFGAVLAVMVSVYSVTFHYVMAREGQEFSWITGLYWTLTVMSTLGFGDITFHSDLGKIFSIFVLLSGLILLLVLLPVTFIQFFYEPWIASQRAARAPRTLPDTVRRHVILTRYDAVTRALIERLVRYHHPYVVLVPELEEALRLRDEGVSVGVGELDDPETYERMRVRDAALVATTQRDVLNTNVAFHVSGLTRFVPIVATAEHEDSVDILQLAGCTDVLQLGEMLGQWLAHRMVGSDALSHTIGEFGALLIAQANAQRTPLVGKSLAEHRLRAKVGVSVVGVWERARFEPADGNTVIHDDTILVLAGTREQLDRYDELFAIYNVSVAPVVVIGAGRVGRATCRALAEREIETRLIEQDPSLIRDPEREICGNAADLATLKKARIDDAPAIIITTNDDDMNVYLTIYCRRLRPDIQVITRATSERTVATLHRAGADTVISYASMGATFIMNRLQRGDIVMLAEGLDLFRLSVPPRLAGKPLIESGIRERTGCSLAAIESEAGTDVNPRPETILAPGTQMILIGDHHGQERFLETFGGAE